VFVKGVPDYRITLYYLIATRARVAPYCMELVSYLIRATL
jgi:hypothetical protein